MKAMRYVLNSIVIMSVVIAMAAAGTLPAVAQNPYVRDYRAQAVVPSAAFHSTSAMSGSGSSYSANPTLNNDGTASYNGASSAPAHGPRRAKMEDPDPSNPFGDQTIGGTTNPNEPGTPIGDAVLPLLLMAFAFCGYLYLRRKRSEA